jgi:hypothetical protein
MQRKSAKLLSELSRMKVLGGIIKENSNSDDNVDYNDIDWVDVAIERRKEIVRKIEKEFGPKNQYSGSADWGGIPVWSVLGSEFEGHFIIDDSEFYGQPNTAFSLMKRTFDPDTEENTDEILFTAFVTPERYGEQGDGTIDKLIEKAKEIKAQDLNNQDLNENIEINAKLSSKKGIKNAIYKILEMNKVEGRYRDEGWQGISKFKNSLEEVGAEVDLLRSNYEGHGEVKDYESMPTRKVFYYEVSVRDKKGNMITVPFKVTCAFVGKTGTMEDDVYELTYYAMA